MTPARDGFTPRDLREHVDKFGNIEVSVVVGGGPGVPERMTGANHTPAAVADFLRRLADEVEEAGRGKD